MRFVGATPQRLLVAITIASLLIMVVRPLVFQAQAASLDNRSVTLSSAIADAQANYKFAFDIGTAGTIGSIDFLFCSNTPLPNQPCTPPTGLDASAATLKDETGVTGFALTANTNELLLARPPQAESTASVGYEFTGITNPSAAGTYYIRVSTYATGDGSGAYTDFGGLAYAVNNAVSVGATVPPYLLFCHGVTINGYDCDTASGDYINFGELSKTQAKSASTQFVVATNAGSGYEVTVNGTTMQSGVNTIDALTSNDVSRPGTDQFGLNLRANSDPSVGQNPAGPGSGAVTTSYNTPNRYRFVSGEQIVSTTNSSDYRKFTVSYIVNVANGQAPGIYVSTLTYIATATF